MNENKRPRVSAIAPCPRDPDQQRHNAAVHLKAIPADLRGQFKAQCARKQITMRDAFLQFMRDFAEGNYTLPRSVGRPKH